MKLTLYVTHRCNLRCTYCYTGRKFDRCMPFEVARRAVDFGLSEANRNFLLVSFFGGEPLLEPDLLQAVVSYSLDQGRQRGKEIFFSLATNGTLMNRRRLELLRRHRFQVQVSLDGCPEAQDATRRFSNGRSSYARVRSTIEQLLAEGFPLTVLAVVDPSQAGLIGESFDHLMDLGVRHIHFSPHYSGRWDERACERLERALQDLGERYMARMRAGQDVRLDPLNGKIVTHVARGYTQRYICQFGRKEVAISPGGRIYPCDRLVAEDNDDAVCIGDLEHGIDDKRRDSMVRAKETADPECASCELQLRCMYWCGCANYETTGDVGRVSPVVCWFERCFIAEADRVANTLFKENVPAFTRRFYAPDLPLAPAPDRSKVTGPEA